MRVDRRIRARPPFAKTRRTMGRVLAGSFQVTSLPNNTHTRVRNKRERERNQEILSCELKVVVLFTVYRPQLPHPFDGIEYIL